MGISLSNAVDIQAYSAFTTEKELLALPGLAIKVDGVLPLSEDGEDGVFNLVELTEDDQAPNLIDFPRPEKRPSIGAKIDTCLAQLPGLKAEFRQGVGEIRAGIDDIKTDVAKPTFSAMASAARAARIAITRK